MKVLDLYAGLRGWSDPWAERGHDVRTLDRDLRFDVTYPVDVLTWDALAELGSWRPDVLLASPPCEGFTVMTIGRNWTGPDDPNPHQPKTATAELALRLVERTRELIALLQPDYFVIENPRAKLRRLPVVADLERRTVWYCHYGETTAKPSDLFGRFPRGLQLKPECHNAREDHARDCCCRDHAAAPRGSRTPGSIQGVTGPLADAIRAKVPERLSLALCLAAERSSGPEARATLF